MGSTLEAASVGVKLQADLRSWAVKLTLASLLVLPFVSPVHRSPQPVFDSELMAAVALFLLGAALATARRDLRCSWPVPAWFAAFLALVLVQRESGLLSYDDQFYFAFIYASASVFAYLVGRALISALPLATICNVLATALIAGAVFSVAIQILQLLDVRGLPKWLYLEVTDPWVRSRPPGNVAQPNILTTYLCWAILGGLFLARGRRSVWLVALIVALLVFGVGLTRSRMGLLFVLCVFALLWLRTSLRPILVKDRITLASAMIVGYGLSIAVIEHLVRFDGLDLPSAVGRLGEGTLALRSVMWLDAWKVSIESPLLGVGFGDYGATHYLSAQFHPALQPTAYVHNLVLQFAAEMGWPLAMSLIALLSWLVLGRIRQRLEDPGETFILALIALLGIHSLLEWPLHSLIFLVPFCLLAAVGEPQSASGVVVKKAWLALGAAFGFVLAVPTFLEYDDLSRSIQDIEVSLSQGKPLPDQPLGTLVSLMESSRVRPFVARTLFYMTPPHAIEPTAESLEQLGRAQWQGADARIITRLILVSAKAGDVDASFRHIDRLLVFFPEEFDLRRSYLLKALEPLGKAMDPVRHKLVSSVPPKIERLTGLPKRPPAPEAE